MGKFSRGCLIVAGTFIAIGLVMGIVVSIMAGRSFFRVVRDNSNEWAGSWNWNWPWDDRNWDWNWPWDDRSFNYDDNLWVNDKATPGNEEVTQINSRLINSMNISLSQCRFTLLEWDGADYQLTINGRGEVYYYTEEGCLYISGFKDTFGNLDENEITLYVPQDRVYERIDLDADIGAYTVVGIEARELECDTEAGSLSLTDVTAENLDLEVGLGEITYSGWVSGDTSVTCAAGKVDMFLEVNESDFNYSIECAAGHVSLNDRVYSVVGSKKIDYDADYDMNVECGAGSVQIETAY